MSHVICNNILGLVLLWLYQEFLVKSYYVFIHIPKGWFTGTDAAVKWPQHQWRMWINRLVANKAKPINAQVVYIIFTMYSKHWIYHDTKNAHGMCGLFSFGFQLNTRTRSGFTHEIKDKYKPLHQLTSLGGDRYTHSIFLEYKHEVGLISIGSRILLLTYYLLRTYIQQSYRQTSNIRRTLFYNIGDHSDVVRASPVGAAPTRSGRGLTFHKSSR